MGETYYKVLGKGGKAPQGRGSWYLPTQSEDGAWVAGYWMRKITDELEFCSCGYHAATLEQLLDYLNYGPLVGTVEYEGELIIGLDKVVGRRARLLRLFPAWDERAMRLFACDCAEHVLHIYERYAPDDARLRKAVAIARRYVGGAATEAEVGYARMVVASVDWETIDNAASYSVMAAVLVAVINDERSPQGRACSVSRSALAAAISGLSRRAWVSERAWQAARLLEYLNGTAEPLAQEAHHE